MAPIIKDEDEQRHEDERRENERRAKASQHGAPIDHPGQGDEHGEAKGLEKKAEPKAAAPMGPGSPKLPPQKAYDPKEAKRRGARGGEEAEGRAEGDDPYLNYSTVQPRTLPPERLWENYAQLAASGLYPRLRGGEDYVLSRADPEAPIALAWQSDKIQPLDMGLIQAEAQKLADLDPANSTEAPVGLASNYQVDEPGTPKRKSQ